MQTHRSICNFDRTGENRGAESENTIAGRTLVCVPLGRPVLEMFPLHVSVVLYLMFFALLFGSGVICSSCYRPLHIIHFLRFIP